MRWNRYDVGRYHIHASVNVHAFMNTANMLIKNQKCAITKQVLSYIFSLVCKLECLGVGGRGGEILIDRGK